jgi:hypothetical protein
MVKVWHMERKRHTKNECHTGISKGTLSEIRVIQGFFTNTNTYFKGSSRNEKPLKVSKKNLHAVEEP